MVKLGAVIIIIIIGLMYCDLLCGLLRLNANLKLEASDELEYLLKPFAPYS